MLAGAELVVGVPQSIAAGPLVGSLLYGVAPTDTTTIVAAAAVMVVVAMAAGYLPAPKASRVDPLVALRVE